MISRQTLLALAPLVATLLFASTSLACPFCGADSRGPTMVDDYAKSMAVVLVHVETDAVLDGNGTFETEFIIDDVLKSHDFLKGKKSFKLKRKIDKGPSRILLFCDIYKDRLDAYRGVEVVPDGDMIKYFRGAVAKAERPIGERLRFAFDYLNSSDLNVATDAFREFAIADYKDYMTMAKELPPDRIAGWLTDPKTQPYRYGLYGSLLGHCGTPEHARMLRKKIEDCIKAKTTDIDGLLAGYVMISPREAWSYVQELLRDSDGDFLVRYACVRTATFLRDQRADLVGKKDLIEAVKLVLETPDMADIGIEFLRKSEAWDCTAQVLGLCGKKLPGKDFDNDFIKRAILRFALRCPDERARVFVQDMRSRNPEFVSITEELLKLEQ